MARLGSVIFWGFVGITSILMFPFAILLRLLTHFFDKRLVLMHKFTSVWGSLYTWFSPFWNVKVQGREKIDDSNAYVMVSNHQSLVDIFVLYRIFKHFKWISKTENFKIPVIGWNMRLNRYIELDRESVKGGGKMMKQSEKTLNEGSSIMIFPEGTRSDTREMRSFKRGAFELALKTNRPVLPIVVDGSSEALPKHGLVLRGKHNIKVKILDPILPSEFTGLSAQELCDKTRAIIQKELNSLREGPVLAAV